jgi:hypothetical protein
MSTRWARFARGWLVAVFATLIAAASHTIAGSPPSVLAIVLSLAFAGMLCVGLAGKRLSRMRLAASVVGSQLLFHQLFASLGSSVWTPAAHVHPGMEPALSAPAMSGSWHPASTSDALWMLVAHAVAAAATFLLLRLAERAFWGLPSSGLLGSARARLRILFRQGLQPVPIDAPRTPSAPCNTKVLASATRRSALRYRGPPATPASTFA